MIKFTYWSTLSSLVALVSPGKTELRGRRLGGRLCGRLGERLDRRLGGRLGEKLGDTQSIGLGCCEYF